MNDLAIILQNIDRLLKLKGLSAHKVSKDAGHPDAIRNIRRKLDGGIKGSDVTTTVLKNLAGALGTTYEELTTPHERIQVRQVTGLREEIVKKIAWLDNEKARAVEELEALDRASQIEKKPPKRARR